MKQFGHMISLTKNIFLNYKKIVTYFGWNYLCKRLDYSLDKSKVIS